mmetsp:Transcript_167124/g.531567  ORF Transcript_167124/g.531567 Transcript_167124/m.531567 type:complete len:154 (+) Transcript_167124:61-522(+)
MAAALYFCLLGSLATHVLGARDRGLDLPTAVGSWATDVSIVDAAHQDDECDVAGGASPGCALSALQHRATSTAAGLLPIAGAVGGGTAAGAGAAAGGADVEAVARDDVRDVPFQDLGLEELESVKASGAHGERRGGRSIGRRACRHDRALMAT